MFRIYYSLNSEIMWFSVYLNTEILKFFFNAIRHTKIYSIFLP